MKKLLVHIVITVMMLALSTLAWGQQDVQMSMQSLSKTNMNPASTGISDEANAHLFVRKQWAGFEGSPLSQMLNVQAFVEDIRAGVGLSVLNDVVGNNRTFNMMLNYAYHVRVGTDKYIALGLAAGLLSRKVGGDLSTIDPETDPEIIEMLSSGLSKTRPDVNLGIAFASKRFLMGFSATHITRELYKKDEREKWFMLPMHLYAFAEYAFDIGLSGQLKPWVQVRAVMPNESIEGKKIMEEMAMQYEVGVRFIYDDNLWLGGAFRDADAAVAMVGLNLGKHWRIGYSYDFKLGGALKNTKTYGSHEIMLNYRLKLTDAQTSEQTPRFFE